MQAPEKDTRRLEDYLDGFFVKQLSETKSIDLPKPEFTLLASCSKTETAKDITIKERHYGAFSSALIEVLDSNMGEISYQDLLSRVRASLTQSVENQIPVMESSTALSPYRLFLSSGEEIDPALNYGVYYQEGKWMVEFGILEGIHLGVSIDGLQFEIYQEGRLIGNASTSFVNFENSELSMGFTADPDAFYQAKVIGKNSAPLAILLSGEQEGKDRFRRWVEQRNVIELNFEESSIQKNYELNFTGQQIILKQGESTIGSISEGDPESYFDGFLETLRHIAFWERVRVLENPGSSVDSTNVKVILNRLDTGPKSAEESWKGLEEPIPGKNKKVSFRLQIDMSIQQEFHYTVLLLSPDFGINYVKSGIVSSKLLQEEFTAYFFETGPHFFKLLFSSDKFNWSLLEKNRIDTNESPSVKTR